MALSGVRHLFPSTLGPVDTPKTRITYVPVRVATVQDAERDYSR